MKTAFVFFFLLLTAAVTAQTGFVTNQNADLMISGVGFNNAGGGLQFNHPNGLATNGTNLLVCDRFNNRVLIWNTAPSAWNTPPDLVLGQPDFTANNPGITKAGLNWPGNASVSAGGKLAIADTNNDRILLWNSFPAANGQSADVSIKLPDICPPGTPMQWGWPWGVWTDGTRLAAVATHGSVLLFWNSFPVSDNQPPDYTVGNAVFGTPRNISTDGETYFFVGDHNAMVNGVPGTFFWNSYPETTNQPYDFYRNEWIKGTRLTNGQFIASGLMNIYTWNTLPVNNSQNPDFSVAPSYYSNGDGVDVVEANGKIYVCNYNGNSVLVYEQPPTSTANAPLFAIGTPDFTHNTLTDMGYVQNAALATDGTRLILTSDFDRKISIYNQFPETQGQLADLVISTQPYDLAPWDNALYNNVFVAVGINKVCIWNNASNLSTNPTTTFNNTIGSAQLQDLKGVALDNQFFYLANRAGTIYIFNGIPANSGVNPLYTINLGNVQLNRLSSDGTYFCVAQQSPAAIFIYRVADIASGNLTPWKTINSPGFLNLPSEAITFNGALAIANQSFNNVLLWNDINNAPSVAPMIILGQANNQPSNVPAIGPNRLFMPGALLYENSRLWVAEHKFSSRVLRFNANCTLTPVITGSGIACQSNTYTYSVPAITGSSYLWSVVGGTILSGQGSNTITVQWATGVLGMVNVTQTTE